MTVLTALLWMLGAAGSLLVLCMGVIFLEKRKTSAQFDERQETARGRGYRFAFFVGFAYFLGSLVYLANSDDPGGQWEVVITCGILLQLAALHLYCLLTHSALPLSRSPLVVAGVFAFMGVGQLFVFLRRLRQDAVMPDFAQWGSVKWVPLALSVTALFLAAAYLISWLRKGPKDDV